ncbi:MAG: cytochrome c [Rudaea sp.]|nr:cytochrome c [Rudaea sp.]
MKKVQKARLIAALAVVCCAAAAVAQKKPESVIHYRQSVMDMIGWNFAPLGAMVKGKVAFDANEFALHTQRIEFLGPQVLEGFEKGSDKGAETDAKAEIWTHFDDFQTRLDDFIDASKALDEAARSGDEARMKEQFKKTAATCKACHDKYRAE